MLKKPITYKDLDGNLRTEDFWFNLSVDEVTELEYDMPGGMSSHWERILQTKDAGEMLKQYKNLIVKSYGERSEDGRYFMKETESGYQLGRRFAQSPAYSALFMELLGPDTPDDSFTEFLRQVVPPELVEKMPENVQLPSVAEAQNTSGERTIEQYSKEELLEMPKDKFDELAGTDPTKWSPAVLQVAFQRKNQTA